jgi:hypothetical protein
MQAGGLRCRPFGQQNDRPMQRPQKAQTTQDGKPLLTIHAAEMVVVESFWGLRRRKCLLYGCPLTVGPAEGQMMQCPRCKTHDVYISKSGNRNALSFLMITVRCHRCCHLFSVPRWSNVTEKPDSEPQTSQTLRRRAA